MYAFSVLSNKIYPLHITHTHTYIIYMEKYIKYLCENIEKKNKNTNQFYLFNSITTLITIKKKKRTHTNHSIEPVDFDFIIFIVCMYDDDEEYFVWY